MQTEKADQYPPSFCALTYARFGKRLRTAGVGAEYREDLLGHKSKRMTTYYSAPERERLIDAVESICVRGGDLGW